MGIFTRVRDIIGSNLSAILDRAEDPEKLIRYMIQEMEDTLVEIKSACAQAMAARKKLERESAEVAEREAGWEARAQMAVDKGRDDLAREALLEKRAYIKRREVLAQELALADEHVGQYKEDIQRLEDKLAAAREKQRMLLARHRRAAVGKKAAENLRKVETSDAWVRFEGLENRIERMEADAELAAQRPASASRHEEFQKLEHAEEIELELARLKAGR